MGVVPLDPCPAAMALSPRRMTAALDLPGLLAAVAAGDRAALRSLYERQSPRLFGVANAILRDRDLAADALQDAFATISGCAGRFDPARGRAEAWLAAIVRHAALGMVRARGREAPTDDPLLGDEAEVAEAEARMVATPEGRRLRDGLAALETQDRAALILSFVHGLSPPQVAARLDVPLGAVRPGIRRALMALRGRLA